MMMLRGVTMLLSTCAFWVMILDSIRGVPLPTGGKGHGKQPLTYKSRSSLRPLHVPEDVNVQSLSLKQVLDMRPKSLKSEHGTRFKGYFANHPDIKAINLNDEDPQRVADTLVNLEHGESDQGTKCRLTACIKDYLAEAPFEKEENRKTIINLVGGKKFDESQKIRHKRYMTGEGKGHQPKHKESFVEAGVAKKTGMQPKVRTKKYGPGMNFPLSLHLDGNGKKKLTAIEAEEAIKGLSHLYTSEAQLTRNFSKYLKRRNIPSEEYNLAMTMRAATIKEKDNERRRSAYKRRKAALATSSASNASSASEGNLRASTSATPSAASASNIHGQPRSPNGHTVQAVSAAPHGPHQDNTLDFNDDRNWQWLTDYLHS